MRISKVYTRTGDQGDTGLVGGERIPKDHPRIAAYGTVDELNSVLGQARAFLEASTGEPTMRDRLEGVLATLQSELFDLGADLATRVQDRWPGMHPIGPQEWERLEGLIDAFNDELPPLKEFILPAGGALVSTLHVARCVCRRAEREVVALSRVDDLGGGGALVYLNRLSDLLFVMARWAALHLGAGEVYWNRRV